MNKLILSSIFCILTLNSMAQQKIVQTAGRDQLGEFAPEFARLNDDILFGEVWSRNDLLSLRDRSLVTLTALISQGMTDSSLTYHLQTARQNGISRTEISEIITHIAFYAGWPKAWAAFRLAKDVWADDTPATDAKAAFQRTMIFPIGEPNTAYSRYFTGLRTTLPQQLAHPQGHEGRRTDAGRRSRTRLVPGGRQACTGNPARHGYPHPRQREALARRGGRQLVCPPGLRNRRREHLQQARTPPTNGWNP